MTDSEAFAFHFAELDRRGLRWPVPVGWSKETGIWERMIWQGDPKDWVVSVDDPKPIDLLALAGILTQALADAGNLTIHTTRDGTNTVTTPAFAVHRKPLLAALVTAYWRAQAAPSP